MTAPSFRSSFRSFFVAFFSVLGVFASFFVILLIVGAIAGGVTQEPEMRYKVEILPNAKGVRKVLSKSSPVILKININGVIGTEFLNGEMIRDQLVESREGVLKNDRVKALLLHINSPGGTVIDSDTIYRLIRTYKEQFQVPVYAFVDGLCASGGIYIAAACDKIYASEVSVVGSIGVALGPFFNIVGTMDKVGAEALMLSAGKGKTDLTPFRKWESGEQDNHQEITNQMYEQFVQLVASDRPKLTKQELIETYGAKVFIAEEAAKIGLIDGSGFSWRKTLELLLAELGIEDDYYQVMQMKSKNWISEFVRGEMAQLKGLTPFSLNPKMQGQLLYLYQPGQ